MNGSFVSSRVLKMEKKVRKFKNNPKQKTAKGLLRKDNINRRITRYLVMNG